MKTELVLNYEWWNLDGDIKDTHKEALKEDALERICPMIQEGFSSGELFSNVRIDETDGEDGISYEGSWSLIIKDYNEKELIEVLNDYNGLVRCWGKIKHFLPELNGKTAIVVEDVEEANKVFKPYLDKIDYILSFTAYGKCDCCQYIFPEEELIIDEEGDFYCNECFNN